MRRLILIAALAALPLVARAEEKPVAPPAPVRDEMGVVHVELRGVLKVWPHEANGRPMVTVRAANTDFQLDATAAETPKGKGVAPLDGRAVIVKGQLTFGDHAGKLVPLVAVRTIRALAADPAPAAAEKKE